MKLRRRRARIAVKEVPERPLGTTAGEVAALRALHTKTSAHEVNEPTPCAVCGGPCAPGSVHWGTWRRHEACQHLAGDPVGRLVAAGRALAHHLDRTDALLLIEADMVAARTYADNHPEPTWTDEPLKLRLPWRHVDRTALRAAVEQLPRLLADAGLVETTCATGCCAWCGVAEALGIWADRGHRWADGTAAPLCHGCAEVYDRAGDPDPAYWDGQRAVLAEACSGVPWPMGPTPPTVRAFAEVADGGDGTAWSHLPPEALEAFRWSAWALYGGSYAPAEHRAEALARARATDAAKAARRAALDAEQRAKADVFGFAERSA